MLFRSISFDSSASKSRFIEFFSKLKNSFNPKSEELKSKDIKKLPSVEFLKKKHDGVKDFSQEANLKIPTWIGRIIRNRKGKPSQKPKHPPPPPDYRVQLKSDPPAPNAPPKQINIKGLSVVKDYLSDYGYIESSGPFTDSFDQEIISAIKTYQNFSNLKPLHAVNAYKIRYALWLGYFINTSRNSIFNKRLISPFRPKPRLWSRLYLSTKEVPS